MFNGTNLAHYTYEDKINYRDVWFEWEIPNLLMNQVLEHMIELIKNR